MKNKILLTVFLAALSAFIAPLKAYSLSVTGMVEIVSPPADALFGHYESNDFARLWAEQFNVHILNPLSVDVIPFVNNPTGFYDSGVAVIEWADKIRNILPKKYIEVKLTVIDENKRRIEINKR